MSGKQSASVTQYYSQVYKIMTGEDHDPEKPELTGSLLFERMQKRAFVIDNGNIVEVATTGLIQDHHPIYSFRIFITPDGEEYESEGAIYRPIQVVLETTRLEDLTDQHDLIGMYAPTGTFPNGTYPMLHLDKYAEKYVNEYLESIHDTLGDSKIPVITKIHMYHDTDKDIHGIPKIHMIYDYNRKVDIVPDAENAATNMVLMDNYYSVPDLYVHFGCSYITAYVTECINKLYLKTCPSGDLSVYREIFNRHMLIGALNLMVKYCEFREFSNHFFKGTRQNEMFDLPFHYENKESEE